MLHVRRLVYAGHKVGLVKQTETVAIKSNSSNKSGPFQRDLCEVYSRGTLIGEIGAEADSASDSEDTGNLGLDLDSGGYIFCVSDHPLDEKGNCKIGFVAVDPSTGSIIFDEFIDSYTRIDLETRLSHLQPVELVLSTDLSLQSSKLCLSKSNLSNSRIEKLAKLSPDMASAKVIDEFTKINAFNAIDQVLSEMGTVVICALEILVRYLKTYKLETLFCSNSTDVNSDLFINSMSIDNFKQINDDITTRPSKNFLNASKEKVFSKFFDKSFMRLDAKALESLDVIGSGQDKSEYYSFLDLPQQNAFLPYSESLKNNTSNKESPSGLSYARNLFQLINHAITPLGQRTLQQWVIKPLIDSNSIKERLDIVALINKSDKLFPISKKSKNKSNFDFISEYSIENSSSSGDEIIELRKSVIFSWMLSKIRGLLRTIVDVESGLCRLRVGKAMPAEAFRIISSFYRITKTFKTVESFDKKESRNKEDAFFTQKISELNITQKDDTLLKNLLNTALFSKHFKFVSMMYNSINQEAAKNMDWMNLFSFESTEISSVTSSDEMKNIDNVWNNGIKAKHVEYLNSIKEIEVVWNEVVSKYFCDMDLAPKTVLGVEYLIEIPNSKVHVSRSIKGNKVKRLFKREADIGVKVPIFKLLQVTFIAKDARHPLLDSRTKGCAIPNDIELNTNGVRGLVLTGPNMGGKSTYVRSVALLAIMAQIGSYVPCSMMSLTPLDGIFTRMGAHDLVMQNQSTFMVEMNETYTPLLCATSRSLVILDELGRGTSSLDGSAIACSVLEHFLDGKVESNSEGLYQSESVTGVNDGDCFSQRKTILSGDESVECLSGKKECRMPLVLFITHYSHIVEYLESKYGSFIRSCHMAYIRNVSSEKNSYSAYGNTDDESYLSQAEKSRINLEKEPEKVVAITEEFDSDAGKSILENTEIDEEITFLYKLVDGVCDNSYGIFVSKLAGLPAQVTNKARIKSNWLKNVWNKRMSEQRNSVLRAKFVKLLKDTS
ncbi:DNA mismatch repair protein msh3 [Smittium culicis]|uniref:DNA mismatch repair protein msh3 n=2 Tax=Smittium culicis TaxID=133412 RepID=A0A1R1XIE4_9FUNG|nr:DNA mismatch repair protein msh3 [Smittium culicis]